MGDFGIPFTKANRFSVITHYRHGGLEIHYLAHSEVNYFLAYFFPFNFFDNPARFAPEDTVLFTVEIIKGSIFIRLDYGAFFVTRSLCSWRRNGPILIAHPVLFRLDLFFQFQHTGP